jgi:transposase
LTRIFEENEMRTRPRRVYEAGFPEQAVALLQRSDRTCHEVAASLGVPSSTLFYWYKRDMASKRAKPKTPRPSAAALAPSALPAETLQQKVLRLEQEKAELLKQNAELKLDRDILKKAAAFFAKESE